MDVGMHGPRSLPCNLTWNIHRCISKLIWLQRKKKKCYVWRGMPLEASLSIHFSKQFWFFNEFFVCVVATKANISFCISMPIKWLERHQNIVLLVAFLQLVLHPIEHSAIQKCHRIHFPIWPYALKYFYCPFTKPYLPYLHFKWGTAFVVTATTVSRQTVAASLQEYHIYIFCNFQFI